MFARSVFYIAGHFRELVSASACYFERSDQFTVRTVKTKLDRSAGQSGNLSLKGISAKLAEVHASNRNPVAVVNG